MATKTEIKLKQFRLKRAKTDDAVRQMEVDGKLGANEIILTPKGTAVPMMPVGSIFMSAIPQTDARVHLLDGSTISQTGVYETFSNLIKALVSAGNNIVYEDDENSTAEQKFNADVSLTGNCGKFIIDDKNGTIRLPKITTFIQGLTDISNIGSSLSAGLPNITGIINKDRLGIGADWTIGQSGCFTFEKGDGNACNYDSSNKNMRIRFNANNGATVQGIYRDDVTTVQPNATQYPYYIVLASGYKSNEVVDIDNVVSDINKNAGDIAGIKLNKANADFSNVNYPQNTAGSTTFGAGDRVIETYISSDRLTWYRKWASGWKECGMYGLTVETNAYKSFTLPIAFETTRYIVAGILSGGTSNVSAWNGRPPIIGNKTINGFKARNDDTGGADYFDLYICGY
jgi:hypothetical protein